MGVKIKRKSAKSEGERLDGGGDVSVEPPSKKLKVLTTEEFIQSLRGPTASQALKQWLYLICNEKERALLDKDTLSSKDEPIKELKDSRNDDDKEIEKAEVDVEACENDADEDEDIGREKLCSTITDPSESIKHIDEFLLGGGSPADLVYSLPSPENAYVSHLRDVFRALSKVLIRISAAHQDKITQAVEVCKELIGSYSKHINDMLTIRRSPRERILNLELLSAMVALDPKFAKEILNAISLEADVVQYLTSARVSHHTRIAYLKFVIALLIDADNSLIMAVVNKPWLLISIMDGLQYDPSDITVLLLMTLKKSVLENKSVPKSAKLIIFNTDAIISLLHLYKWKGPLNRPKSLTFWAMKKMADKPKLLVEVDPSEAELVSSSVQELLLVLLTDHRFGIIFRDASIGHKSDRHNKMISRVLQRIGHPWEEPKVAQLVSKILSACPDALHCTLESIEPFLAPRQSEKWFRCANFIKQVLEDQRPEEVLYRQISWLTMTQLSAAAMEMCSPKSVLIALSSDNAAALYSDDVSVAKCSVDLLVCMLRKINGFVGTVSQWTADSSLTYAQATSFRRHVTESLLLHVPNLDHIKKSWELWSDMYLKNIQAQETDGVIETPIDILSHLLELMEMYHRLCPAALDPFHSAHSDFKSSISVTVSKADSDDVAQLRNRFYQLLLAINDPDFCVGNRDMHEPLCLLFADLTQSNHTTRLLAFSVLQTLMSRAGFLEGSPHESVVWLTVFQETFAQRDESLTTVVNLLVESMTRTCTACPTYVDIIARSEEGAAEMLNAAGASLSSLFDGAALQELFDEAMENPETIQSSSYLTQVHAATVSPWLPAFLEVLQEYTSEKKIKRRHRKVVEEFLCKLLVRLMYRLPHPGSFFHLVLYTYSDIIPIQLRDYIQSWLPEGNPRPIESSFLGEDSFEVYLSSFLLEDEISSFPDGTQKLFCCLALPKPDDYLKDGCRSEMTAKIIQTSYFVCFHLSQLALLEKLTTKHTEKSQEIFLSLSDIALHFDQCQLGGKDRGLFFEFFKVILSHPLLFQQFNPLTRHNTDSSTLLTNLIMRISKMAFSSDALQGYLIPYKEKFLTALNVAIKTKLKKNKNPKDAFASFVDAFSLQFQDISNILDSLTSLPSSSMVDSDASDLSQWCLLVSHLLGQVSKLRAERGLSENSVRVLSSSAVSKISNWLLELLPYCKCDLTPLVESFLMYIKSCPQQTHHIPHELLPTLLSAKWTSFANGKLAEWLAWCVPLKDLTRSLKSSISEQETAYKRLPVILSVIRVGIRNKDEDGLKKSVLMAVYELIKEDVQQSVTSLANHPEWLSQYTDIVVILMKRFMEPGVREKLCKALEKKAPALTVEKLYYLKLVSEVVQRHPPQHILLLIAWLGASLKKYAASSDQACLVESLCKAIADFMKADILKEFSYVRSSKAWQETLRLSLKLGLNPEKEIEKVNRSEETQISCLILKTVSLLIKKMYASAEGVVEEIEHLQMVHSMITQHSEFVNVMMGSSPTKLEIVQMLYNLLRQCPNIMDNSHVPILLSSYNASMSQTDRSILRILMLYEESGVDLSPFRPYFWGRQGANHYSIWSCRSKPSQSLWQQPRPDQVLGLLEDSVVMETIGKFPIHSTMNVKEDECQFYDGIYDPSFCLPLFMYLLSPESPVLTHMFVKSGAFALTLSSLSSFDVTVRAAAYTTLSRFISHLQMARGQNKDLLLHFMSAVQKGISSYGNDSPRLPSVVSVFLARSAVEISNPSSPLYKSLINFILAKPIMNLHTVPEFLPLLHSDGVEHLAHRLWICQVLADGLRSPVDVSLCMGVVAFKLLPSFYSCCLPDFKTRLCILRCLRSAVTVQYGALYLVRDYSLCSWLHQVIVDFRSEDVPVIVEMVRLLSALWNSLSMAPEKIQDSETGYSTPRIENPSRKLLPLLLALHLKLSAPVGLNCLSQYYSVLSDVTANLKAGDICLFSREVLLAIIDLALPHKINKRQFLDMLEFGCKYTDIPNLVSSESVKEDEITSTLSMLTTNWIRCTDSCSEI